TGGDGSLSWIRTIKKNTSPLTGAKGWRILLGSNSNPYAGMTQSAGERAQRRVFPFYSANLAMLFTLVPKNQDPCVPGNDYGFVVIDAATGSFSRPSSPMATSADVGVMVGSPRPLGSPIVPIGGG